MQRNGHRDHDLPSGNCFEVTGERVQDRIKRECRLFKGCTLAEVEEIEEISGTQYSSRLSNHLNLSPEWDYSSGRSLWRYFSEHSGLHIDEVYRRLLTEAGERSQYLRATLADSFILMVGSLRLKWNDDGTRKYGDLGVDDLFIDEKGIMRKAEPEVNVEKATSAQKTSSQKEVVVTRRRESYPRWSCYFDCYYLNEDKYYERTSVFPRIFQAKARGEIWLSFERISQDEARDLLSTSLHCGRTLDTLYLPALVTKRDGSHWRTQPASCEESVCLDRMRREGLNKG